MKRRRREAGGGEIALMAVITKAMGAFLVLVVIMLPHYTFVLKANQTAEKAQDQINQAMSKAEAVADALKKGRLTDEEIDKLLAEIADIKRQLEELKFKVAALKNELDQSHAEIARLQKKQAELEAEIARLREEVEKLKNADMPTTVAVVSWKSCPGGRIDMQVQSNSEARGGKRPVVERRKQDRFWANERKSAARTDFADGDAGNLIWESPDPPGPERLEVWVKLLNPVPIAGVEERSCNVLGTIMSRSGKQESFDVLLSESRPMARGLVVDRVEDGTLTRVQGDDWKQRYEEVFASPCEGLLCTFRGDGKQPLDLTQLRATFIADAKSRISVSEQSAGMIFDLIAENRLPIGEAFVWLELFPGVSPPKRAFGAEDDSIMLYSNSLKGKGVPPSIVDEIVLALREKRLGDLELVPAIGRMKVERAEPLLPTGKEGVGAQTGNGQGAATREEAEAILEAQVKIGILNEAGKGILLGSMFPAIPRREMTPPAGDKEIDEAIATTSLPKEIGELVKKQIKTRRYSLKEFNDARLIGFNVNPAAFGRPRN